MFSIYLGAGGYSFYSVPGEEGEIRGCCTQDNFYRIFPVQYIDEILSVRDGEADLWTDYGEPVWFEIQALVDDMYAGYYAEFALREEDEGSWIDMSLNAAGIADINAALGNSFGVAGNNPVVYCTNSIGIDEGGCVDRMFESPDSGFGKLTLTGSISVVPIPAAVWLFGSGLAALAGLRRWRAADTRL